MVVELRKHHDWNETNSDYLMSHDVNFQTNGEDEARYLQISEITISTNLQSTPDNFDLHDPWYAYQENGEWIQLDKFFPLTELTNDGTYNVFLNQGDINDPYNGEPIYTVRAPIYVTEGNDTYMFDGWSGENVSFNELAHETPVVFHQPETEIVANYVLVSSMNQVFSIPPGFINMISFNVLPDNPAIASIFSGVTNIMIQDDNGGFFVPSFSIDTIGDVDIVEGYKIDYWDSETINLSVPGLPAYSHTEITINGNNSMNYFPYLSQDPMDIDEAFADIFDDILIIQSDMGGYYIPIYNLNSIYTLLPGEAYYFTSNSSDPIKFRLPRPATPRQMSDETLEEKLAAMESQYFYPVETGNSFPVLVEGLEDITVGDEIVAYSNGSVVGATRIANPRDPVLVVVWNAIEEENRKLPGFIDGDELDLRLWSQDQQVEISLTGDLISHPYGEIELLSGEMTLGSVITPLKYQLSEPYPNPFNPITTIRYELPENGMVNIVIYDMIGREVTQLINAVEEPGYHSVQWDATQFASGTYFVKMTSREFVQTQKIMLVK
ncbi:MAG: T9SS type A sorting domain-containing protein [Candidatus Marinimicrobia bacterium]|nr:T9SS type A sorting domain-containing protein [Candidatus Neomarinimicrobiota bacterium]